MALSIATFTTPLEQAAFTLAQQYSSKQSSRDNIPTDNLNNVLDVASIARILLDLPPQLSTVRILVQLIETRYRNLSAEMVGQWCSIRSQMEPAKGDDDAARKEKPPLVSDDDLLPDLAADSSGSLASSSVPACPETTTTSVPSSPTAPTHDAMPSATPQSPTTTSTPSTTMEPAPVDLSMVSPLLVSGPQDLPDTLPLHSSLANTNADSAGSTTEQNEDENIASINASVPAESLSPTPRDVDNQTISTLNANVSSPLFITPPPSPDFEQEWPRSVPLSPTPRTRLRSRFAQTISNSEDLWTQAESPPRADSFLSDDWFFVESTITSTRVVHYSRVPPPDLQSVAYLALGALDSPTRASGSGSRGQSRRYRGEEEEVTRGPELGRNEEVSGDTTPGRQNIAPSTSNRRKRRREDNRDREDGQPRARQSVEDNFARRILRRLTPSFLRNLW